MYRPWLSRVEKHKDFEWFMRIILVSLQMNVDVQGTGVPRGLALRHPKIQLIARKTVRI